MAYSHFPRPEPLPDPPGLLALDNPPSIEGAAAPDSAAIFHTLQQLISAGVRGHDLILGKIAEAAQSLTGCSGAAIATRQAGVVFCQGRSGESAPGLGTRLSVDCGISGECLRTGKAVRCDDTRQDDRVDQEVCRQLGLRSVAAVALRQGGKAAGILEAFSTRPHAFTEEHMDLLARLAQLAEAAAFESAREAEAVPDLLRQAPQRENDVQGERRQHYQLAGVALTINILLFLAVGWMVRHNSASGIVRRQPQPTVATSTQPMTQTAAPDGSSGGAAVPNPSPAHARSESRTTPAPRVGQRTAGRETANLAAGQDSVLDVDIPDAGDRSFMSASRPTTDTAELQGLSGGILVRKVRPIYPPQARALHLRGSVLLQAIITENGEVRDLKVKGGHPLLVRAAVEAASQWRYRPFLLNGKPIQRRVDIPVDFKMPE
jgi:TonB family protein